MPIKITHGHVFATAEDGTPLDGTLYEPDYTIWTGLRDVHLLIHGGGFTENDDGSSQQQNQFASDLADRGYICLSNNYRLVRETPADPGIPGQVTMGIFPDQYNDCKRAALYLLNPPIGSPIHGKTSGRYAALGGSAGGTEVLQLLADTRTLTTPVPWDATKRPLFGISFSGAHKFDDLPSQSTNRQFLIKCAGYCGITQADVQHGNIDQVLMLADSPYPLITAALKPLLAFNGTTEAMPLPQLTTVRDRVENQLGLSNCQFITDSGQFAVGGKDSSRMHSWTRYSSPAVQKIAMDWITAQFGSGGTGGGPPPPTQVPLGCDSLTSGRTDVPQSVLDDPSVDLVSVVEFWEMFEPTKGTFSFTYLDQQIKSVVAAGKNVLLRVLTMGGVADGTAGAGHTPQHVWTDMSSDRNTLYTAHLTNASPNITTVANQRSEGQPGHYYYVSEGFKPSDVGLAVTGTGIPAGTTILSVADNQHATLSAPATLDNQFATVQIVGRGNLPTNVWTPGYTYNFDKKGALETVPLFWNPAFRRRKHAMYAALGAHLTTGTTLTPTEKSSVQVMAVSCCNAHSEDWNVPHGEAPIGIEPLAEVQMWQNAVDGVPGEQGSGYETNFLIKVGISKALPGASFSDEVFVDADLHNGINHARVISRTADFYPGDVGKTMVMSAFAFSSVIKTYISPTEVELTDDHLDVTAPASFVIQGRDSGVIDRAMTHFPNQFITMAIATNGTLLDRTAAKTDANPLNRRDDVGNYVPRVIMNRARSAYGSRMIAQVNALNDLSPTYEAAKSGKSQFSHLAQIHDAGGRIAFQNLWFCSQDPSFTMNGGTNINKDTGQPMSDLAILELAISVGVTYQPLYIEIYDKDVQAFPQGTKFAHDLLTGDDGGGGGGGGGGGTPGQEPPPFQLSYDYSNYRDEVQAYVADLLNVSIKRQGIQAERADKWARSLTKHARYAWQLIAWPQFNVTEARAFAPFWNPLDSYQVGDRVFYVPTSSYYDAFQPPPPGTLPTNAQWFAPVDLTSLNYFIPILQHCRRRIGQVIGVFPADPRMMETAVVTLPARLSQRGIDVVAFSSAQGSTSPVWLSYQAVPYKWGADLWNSQLTYRANSLVLFDGDGEVYRAVVDNVGVAPTPDSTRWAMVPFPTVLVNFCTYMTAADDIDDRQQASEWRQMAIEYLAREMDEVGLQTPTQLYDFGSRDVYTVPCEGLSGFLWSVYAPFTGTNPTDLTTQISTVCVNEWGDPLPT